VSPRGHGARLAHPDAPLPPGDDQSAVLGAGQHGLVLKDFCEEHYKTAKSDLANVFLERCLKLCAPGGTVSFVMPQNWLFMGSYQKQREHLLTVYNLEFAGATWGAWL
jgi:hypothetical protein